MSQFPTHPPPAYPPPPPPAPRRRRALPLLVAVAGAAVLVGAAVTVPLVVQHRRDAEAAAGPVDLSAVREYDGLEVGHTTADVDYPQSPPVGGPHDPAWLDCGAYDEPVRNENAVHDLEHGAVWIAYEPGLAAADVDALAEALPQNGIMSPYPGLDAPVVVTVWGRQLNLDGADDPRLPLFIRTYGGGETAPEPFASCAGGVGPGGGQVGTSV